MPILMIDLIGLLPLIMFLLVVSAPQSQYYLAEFDGVAYVSKVLFLQG